MGTRSKILPLLFIQVFLSASVEAQLSASKGINLKKTGSIYGSQISTLPTNSFDTKGSWEFDTSLQGRVLPVGNFTGLLPTGSPLNFEDLLPLKASKLRVMIGEDGSAPTETGTLIDAAGVDTNAVITDALYLVDPSNGQGLPMATVSGGKIVFTSFVSNAISSFSFPNGSSISSETVGSIIAGGNGGNIGTGLGSLVLGGYNQEGQQNLAKGIGSAVISSGGSQATGSYSTIIGSRDSRMHGTNAHHNSILGGADHEMQLTSGSYNVISGGADHTIASGMHISFIGGGERHRVNNGGWRLAMLGGFENTINYVNDAVVIGGTKNQIGKHPAGIYINSNSTIMGGYANSIDQALNSSIISGEGNEIPTGTNITLMGERNRGRGRNQVVIGRFNQENDSTQPDGHAFIIGNGKDNNSRSNALSVDWNGNLKANSIILTAPQGNISMGAFTDD